MRQTLTSLAILGLVTTSAGAQPTTAAGPPKTPPTPPAEATEPPKETSAVAPPVAPVEPAVTQSKKPNAGFDKGFFLRSDDGTYALLITGRFQPFLNLNRTVTATPMSSDPEHTEWRNAFEVRRMRVVLDGNLHSKALTYKLQVDFGRGVPTVRDAHFDIELQEDVWVRIGQWKRPFSRQHITSSGRLETADRAITDRAFGAGRDIGIALRNNYEKSPDLEWTVGVFNGTGEAPRLTGTVTTDPMTGMGTIGTTTNTNVPSKFRPAVIARVGLNRNGLKGYSEADLEGGPLRWGAGASVWLEGDFDGDDRSNQRAELDYLVKARGFSTTGGVYAMTDQDGDAVTDAEASLVGFHVQAGYMLAKHWQASARYAYINDPRQKPKTARDQQELGAYVNFYGMGHDAKFVAGGKLVKTGDAAFTDFVLIEIGGNVGW